MTSRAEKYWSYNNSKYPHQIDVEHMSKQDPDPRRVQALLKLEFLRVPFDGRAYWGFQTKAALDQFKQVYHITEETSGLR